MSVATLEAKQIICQSQASPRRERFPMRNSRWKDAVTQRRVADGEKDGVVLAHHRFSLTGASIRQGKTAWHSHFMIKTLDGAVHSTANKVQPTSGRLDDPLRDGDRRKCLLKGRIIAKIANEDERCSSIDQPSPILICVFHLSVQPSIVKSREFAHVVKDSACSIPKTSTPWIRKGKLSCC